MAFTRTTPGLVIKWKFYQTPTIWVEGPTDLYFYEPALGSTCYRIEPFYGIENSDALIEGLVEFDYPYVVILDGDYCILKPQHHPHRRVIRLCRYSVENYLWEEDCVNKACLRYARCGDQKDLLQSEMARLSAQIKEAFCEMIKLDVAGQKGNSPPKVMPDHADMLMADSNRPDIDYNKIKGIIAKFSGSIDSEAIMEAERDIQQFLAERPLTHLLKGHVIFGILRRLFVTAITEERKTNIQISNDAFMQILAEMIWRKCRSKDHQMLKESIQTSLNEILPKFAPAA